MAIMRTVSILVLVVGAVGVVGGGVLRWLGLETDAPESGNVDKEVDDFEDEDEDEDYPDGPFNMVTEDNIEGFDTDSDEDYGLGSYSDEEL